MNDFACTSPFIIKLLLERSLVKYAEVDGFWGWNCLLNARKLFQSGWMLHFRNSPFLFEGRNANWNLSEGISKIAQLRPAFMPYSTNDPSNLLWLKLYHKNNIPTKTVPNVSILNLKPNFSRARCVCGCVHSSVTLCSVASSRSGCIASVSKKEHN